MVKAYFDGFVPPVNNYFRMPNEWINISAEITSLAELKVVQYVLRHTWGYHEYDGKPKPITIDEFMHGRKKGDGTRMDNGTGLSNRSVIDGIRHAVEHGYLVCEVDDTDRARVEKSYALKMIDLGVNFLHSENGREESSQPDMKNLHTTPVKKVHSDREESSQRSEKETKEKHFKKDREKESVPSLPLSQKNEEETKPTEVDYPLFDRLCQEKGYAPDFKVPRNEKNNAAIQELRSQSATPEQVEFVFNDIWDDRDTFWRQHRGKPSTVASQFTARVWKMTAPAPKRQTASGMANWTEDKTVGTVPSAPKATEKPKEPSLPTGYTRAKFDTPRRPRTLQGRLEAQNRKE